MLVHTEVEREDSSDVGEKMALRRARVFSALVGVGILGGALLTGSPAASTTLTTAPTVIGGQADHPWSGAAVYFETSFGADGSSLSLIHI